MDQKRPRLGRRGLVLGGGVVALAALTGGAYVAGAGRVWKPDFAGDALSPQQALDLARAGEVLLVDIRRPDEWAQTGIGAPAHALDLRRPDFVSALSALVEADHGRPVALICARGVRSARLARALSEAGFTRILDVPEGMLGSKAGPGWLARGLPVRVPS